jgi:GGDEF domain-containing protein
MSSPDSVLGRFVQRIEHSYPLPDFSQKAWPALDMSHPPATAAGAIPAGGIDTRRLIEALAQNPDWTAGLFAAARHPQFGALPAGVLSSKAIGQIESPVLAAFLYGFGLPGQWFEDLQHDELQRYWQRTLFRTVAARLLALNAAPIDCHQVLPVAMVADFGMLVLYRELKQTYRDFVSQARATGQDLYQMELESLGFDHRILAARLLDAWPVPSRLGVAVGRIHVVGPEWEAELASGQDPRAPRGGDAFRVGILHVADQAACLLIDGGTETAVRVAKFTRQVLEWDLADLQKWLGQIPELAHYLAHSFGLTRLGIEFPLATDGRLIVETAWDSLAPTAPPLDSGDRLTEGSTASGPRAVGTPVPSAEPLVTPSAPVRLAANTSPDWKPGQETAAGPRAQSSDFPREFSEPSSAPGRMARATGGPATAALMPSALAEWGSDPALLGQLRSAVELCRARRQPLSLLLAQIDGFESLLFGGSIDEVYSWQERIFGGLCQVVESEGGRALEVGEDKFALILPGIERTSATRVGQEILRIVRHWSEGRLQAGRSGLSLSLGCAATGTPPRNFRGELLLEAAQRCLEYVQRAAGNGIKSIEIF